MSFLHHPRERVGEMRTVRALLVHERGYASGPHAHYLTTHPVDSQASGPRIGPGRLLTQEDVRALVATLTGTLAQEEFAMLPPETLALGSAGLAWYVAGRVRPMYFSIASRAFSLHVPWPTLVFLATERGLCVAAITKAARPRPDTALFHAPLMNLNAATRLCAGTAPLPARARLEECAGFERAMFESNFSHVNHPNTLSASAAGTSDVSNEAHLRFWRRLARQRTPRFPTRALMPLQCTLEEWLRARALR